MPANQYPFGVGRLPADALNAILAGSVRMGASLRRVAAQNLPTGAFTSVSWDTEDFDSNGLITPHATTATTITIPVGGGGIWAISVTIIVAVAPTGLGFVSLNVNGGGAARGGFADNVASASVTLPLNAGATIVVDALRNAAAATTMTGTFYAYRVAN